MRAIQYYGFGGPWQVDEVDPPRAEADEVVVGVRACQVAGDVLKVLAGSGPVRDAERFKFPHIPGYRGAGLVEAVGGDVKGLDVGDRVVVNGFVNCGKCERCLSGLDNLCQSSVMLGLDPGAPGSLAERVVAPARAVFALPDDLGFPEATVVSNLALLVHALERAGPPAGFSVAIFGCGFVGSAAISVAKAYGAERIIAIDREVAALAFARRCGATDLIEVHEGQAIADQLGEGVDVTIEVVGVPQTVEQAIMATRPRGTALLIGALGGISLTFPDYYGRVIQREGDIRPCFGKTQADFARAIELLGSGRLEPGPYSFRTYDLEAFGHALEAAGQGGNTDLHIITPNRKD